MSKYNCPYHGTKLRESKMTQDAYICDSCREDGTSDGIFDGVDLKAGKFTPNAQSNNNRPKDNEVPPTLPQGLPLNHNPTPPPMPQARNATQGQRRVLLLNNRNVHGPAVLRGLQDVFGLPEDEAKRKIMEAHLNGSVEVGTAHSDAEVEQMKRDFQDVLRNAGYDYDIIEDENNIDQNNVVRQDPWDLMQPPPMGFLGDDEDDDDLELDEEDDEDDDTFH